MYRVPRDGCEAIKSESTTSLTSGYLLYDRKTHKLPPSDVP
jgi:hypothetical protein